MRSLRCGCTHQRAGGRRFVGSSWRESCAPRFGSEYYSSVTPVYEELPGWSESTAGVRQVEQLPANARSYIRRIEEAVRAPIDIISTGADRAETIVLKDPFGGPFA